MGVLHEKATLVRLSVSRWSGTKADKKAAAEVAERHGAAPRSGSFTKKLIQDNPWVQMFGTAANKAVDYHMSVTMPWMDNGQRVLPAELYWDYTKKMREIGVEADQAIERIIENFDQAKKDAKKSLGSLYNEADYPTPEELRNKFKIKARFFPFPDTKDWRIDIGDEEINRLRSEVEDEFQEAQLSMANDLWQRLFTCVEGIHERLADPSKIFKKSLISNAEELLDILPKLNIADDPQLNALIAEARTKLVSHDAEELREDANLRAATAKEAAVMIGKINKVFPGATKQAA